MITAIVTLSCEVGKVHTVAEELVACPGIAEVYSISGEFDIMAMVRVKEYDDLATTVTEGIAAIDGITSTRTNMAFRCYCKQNMERVWGEFIGDGE
ncbi:MAG: Lrp/AsnC ligand binding domain-containing protein [Lentisphaerae bacterium]|nr:Lrp/AsnC ligand binding domain-containing protein [Lentisphaerota bacterium]MBT4814850.1 Lrp/AsnC ligand binding domain-containing protein [Lentisphaerota bacterium]MBT5612632.1 Lrp/AsnC ligand binding domain-containing protein [Lentisphaerota bacterium]MBT7057353.1 Lrp/AsnC ligand binding domain-containing protein [Lentisphaerota bacterium]MBT7846451.1 Lrp/AsnC ligand binding domain-containing protein [Lentisphaerota bacterium]